VIDLGAGALLPGFIDPHSHLLAHAVPITGWAKLVSRPPVGEIVSIPDLLAALEAHAKRSGRAAGSWIIGYGYEREALSEGRELTCDDLDARFPRTRSR
jgi:predicted amidohydrolase YtcJ